MNAYQRGGRDALLSFAAHLAAESARLTREADAADARLSRSRGDRSHQWRVLVEAPLHRAEALDQARVRALGMADALPDDPEAAADFDGWIDFRSGGES